MKSYALPLFLLLLLFIVGCGSVEETESETSETMPIEETSDTGQAAGTTESQTIDDITAVETVEEDLSVNDEEDDYGDII